MFNLMSNCCNWISKIQQPIRKVNVLVVGLDKAGKTSSVRGMLRVPPVDVDSSYDGCVSTDIRLDNFLVSLLDIGGAPDPRGAWRETCSQMHGVIFVVDSSDRARMKEVKECLGELLKQPRVAGKPLLVLANKQDKLNALLGSELIEILALEKLVNQSRSLCHIEPCSALMDLRRWSDKRTLRGLRWLLHAISLDYPELCARIARDSITAYPLGTPDDKYRRGKCRKKPKEERTQTIKNELRQVQRPPEKDQIPRPGSAMQPIRNILKTESSLKKKLTRKKKKRVMIKDTEKGGENEEEEGEGPEEESASKEKPNSALIPPKRKTKQMKRGRKVKEERQNPPESLNNEDKQAKAKGEKKKKKKVIKVKRKKNKIISADIPGGYSQPVDLSATFGEPMNVTIT